MLRPKHGARAERDGAANGGAEVLRILDLVERQKERRRLDGEIGERMEAELGRHRDDPLVARAGGAAIELRARRGCDFDALVARETRERFELRMIALLDQYALDPLSVRAHGL